MNQIDDELCALMRTAYAACDATRADGGTAYKLAAHLHDEIVNLRRKLKGEPRCRGSPWPFARSDSDGEHRAKQRASSRAHVACPICKRRQHGERASAAHIKNQHPELSNGKETP